MREGLLHRLRRKPHHIRERILWATILPVWLVIFVMWLGALFGSSMSVYEEDEPGTVSPASALLGTVGTIGDDIKHRWMGEVTALSDSAEQVLADAAQKNDPGGAPLPSDTPVGAEILGAFEEADLSGESGAMIATTTATTTSYGQ